MSKNIAIVGAGASGLFAAYTFSKDKNYNVYLFEQGADIDKRHCPIMEGKANKCINCANCHISGSVGGAGAFSDGKYILSTEYGGWLQDVVGKEKAMEYMYKADDVLVSFGATTKFFEPDDEMKKTFLQNNLHMLQARCKHLGTDANYETMVKMVDYLKSCSNIHILSNTRIINVFNLTNGKKSLMGESKFDLPHVDFDYVIFAVGRSGSRFFNEWCTRNDIPATNNQVDIGVRVEIPAIVWNDFTDKIYEPKIVYKTKQYEDWVRSFCVNPKGEVVVENNDGILSVNGHSYSDPSKYTNNTNFALLSTIHFTEPFNEPVEYARRIVSLANAVSGGSVIVQTLGDLERGRRTNEHRLSKNTVVPTLKAAVAGDLSLCMPKRQLDNIIETLHAIDKAMPGTANPDTLLYGIEAKYYSAKVKTDENFEFVNNGVGGYYAVGDGSGMTRSLSQASAQGIMVAENIMNLGE